MFSTRSCSGAQQAVHAGLVPFIDLRFLAQFAFPFATLLGQNMTFECVRALQPAGSRAPESLFGTAVGLCLGHSPTNSQNPINLMSSCGVP